MCDFTHRWFMLYCQDTDGGMCHLHAVYLRVWSSGTVHDNREFKPRCGQLVCDFVSKLGRILNWSEQLLRRPGRTGKAVVLENITILVLIDSALSTCYNFLMSTYDSAVILMKWRILKLSIINY